MERGETQHVLYVNTPTRAPLGADTWIHVQVVRHVPRDAVTPHVALVRRTESGPTPTFEALRSIHDLQLVDVDFGRELDRRSRAVALRGAARGVVATIVSLARLRAYARRQGIDLIHTSDRPRDALACVLLSKATGIKLVIHLHVAYGEWMSRSLRWSLRRADALVAISHFVRSSFVAAGYDPARIDVVHNGIELDSWTPKLDRDAARHELGGAEGGGLVVSACRLFPEKGPVPLIEAFAEVRRQRPDARLVIVGNDVTGGRFRAELDALVARLGLGDGVVFAGYRNDVARVFAAGDVYAMPSYEEPFGLVFLEAMAMQLPVVALDSGGTPEVVTDGRTGLLSAPGDHDALVANLGRLLDDPALRAALGSEGRRVVAERFTAQRMAAGLVCTYRRVTGADFGQEDRGRGSSMETRVAVGRVSPADIDECRKRMDEDGYVVFENVVSGDRLDELAAELQSNYERARRSGELFNGGGMLTGHLNCFPGARSRFVYDDLQASGVIDVVRSLRPDIVDRPRVTLNYNLPGSVAQHYHADGLYTDEFLICNVAVVDTDLVNGALDVLPGTHRRFYKFWRYAFERKYRLTTRVTMRRGDAVLRKSTLWHRGMPNGSSRPRPMMAVTFGELGAPEGDPFALNDGQPYFFPNWYRTSRLGQLRERTYVAAPITYSAWRFARSLYGNKGYSSF